MPVNRDNRINRRRFASVVATLMVAIFMADASPSVYAQGTSRYVYDDNGRLHAVIAPNGEANIYEYDAAGNITAIRRNTANTLEVLDFFPHEGAPGTPVTIIGTGFGPDINSVEFNSTSAQGFSVNAPQIVVTVPPNATTGPISVTTPGGTATSNRPFIVRGITVNPPTLTLSQGVSVQLTATVFPAGSQTIRWSVDGIEGGSASLGTVTMTGLFTTPVLPLTQPIAIIHVRASSMADPTLFGESVITVKNPEFLQPAFAHALSIRNGVPQTLSNTFSGALSIRNGVPETLSNTFTSNVSGSAVSLANGPAISAISPAQLQRGISTNVTISGTLLSGATALSFIDLTNNVLDSNISVSNLNVNGAGTSLTATLMVNGAAALGRRVVIVRTSGGVSQSSNAVVNTLDVTQ